MWRASRSGAMRCYRCFAPRGSSPRRPRPPCMCGCRSPRASRRRGLRGARSWKWEWSRSPAAGLGRAERDSSASRSRSTRRGWSRPPSGWERCSPLFEIRRPSLEFRRLPWAVSAVAHVAIIIVAFSGSWRIDRPQGLITIIPPARPQPPELPPFGGSRRGKGPSGGLGRPLPGGAAPDTTRPVPAPVGKPDSTLAASPAAVGPHLVSPPQVGDGRLWVLPRPALPSDVADALYEPQENRDTTVVRRLRAMVDSLNVFIDQDQRSRQRPVWTTDVAGKVFGIDSQFIHVAGIKIPTAALALLPISLPQGNYDEQRRGSPPDQTRGGPKPAAPPPPTPPVLHTGPAA